MTFVQERVDDAVALWREDRREGAFLLALVAVVARARQDFPRPMGEAAAFRSYFRQRFTPRLSIEYRGKMWPIEDIFYKWFRCEIVHAGGLPVDIGFLEDTRPGDLRVRAGGAPEYRLLFGPAWFDHLIASAQA
jgi:hypothetical protein